VIVKVSNSDIKSSIDGVIKVKFPCIKYHTIKTYRGVKI
jgi:hypothetical protein